LEAWGLAPREGNPGGGILLALEIPVSSMGRNPLWGFVPCVSLEDKGQKFQDIKNISKNQKKNLSRSKLHMLSK